MPVESKKRPIPNFSRFSYLLYDRIYAVIKLHEIIKYQFTLLLNLQDRSKEVLEDYYIYAGVDRQRELMGATGDQLEDVWNQLKEIKIPRGEAPQSSRLFTEAERQRLDIDDFIEVGRLKDYFKESPDKKLFENQLLEKSILEHYFDIDRDRFVSIPIYSFAQLEGVAHFIVKDEEIDIDEDAPVRRRETMKRITRLLMVEYDGLLLDWDLDDESASYYQTSRVDFDQISSLEYYNEIDRNPILTSIGCRKYYESSKIYLQARIRQNNAIPARLLDEHRRRAIIAILIDSYAHNISAHSLTVLKWWFQQRAAQYKLGKTIEEIERRLPFESWGAKVVDFLMDQFPNSYGKAEVEEGVRATLARWFDQLRRRSQGEDPIPVRDQLFPLSKELAPLFKFLLEKGAFWSGVTRDEQFGGETRSFFDILWNDFINNPLYLGTIAYSERITKLNIHIRIYDEVRYQGYVDSFKRTYKIRQAEVDGQQKPLDGVIANIEMGGLAVQSLQHHYVNKGPMFGALAQALDAMPVFLPGGVVGKHAFFTLIENEIRNVKHFPESELEKMRADGLTLVIGIRPTTLRRRLSWNAQALYKVGIWLNHYTNMSIGDDHLIIKRLNGLESDIITRETHRAKLGGSFQDKICAAMLFNNTFISVQRKDASERDKAYYPWIRAAFSTGIEPNGVEENDFEVKLENIEDAKNELSRHPKDERGYFKKYFHIWQGAPLFPLTQIDNLHYENLARFKMVVIPENSGWYEKVRKEGVIRVIETSEKQTSEKEAYGQWLQNWFNDSQLRLVLMQGSTQAGHLVLDEDGVRYYNAEDYERLPHDEKITYGDYEKLPVPFAHSEKNKGADSGHQALGVRSHGVFATKFFDGFRSIDDLSFARLREPILAYELAEALATRICVFDKRLADRAPQKKREMLSKYLFCDFFGEDVADWKNTRQRGLWRYHFVIVHLSFIEAMLDRNGKRYGESGVVRFIEDEVLRDISPASRNFVFVITTGRGRTQWWEELSKSQYMHFTTFRPVESLIEATESGIVKKDDIELKYNLVKVLLGS